MDQSNSALIERTARHEAGHAVTAHAVGRRVVKVRCTPMWLDADDPLNPDPGQPFETHGFHQATPLRGPEVEACLRVFKPLPADLRQWCQQDAVICLAGPIAEGILGQDGGGHDIEEWQKSARALGKSWMSPAVSPFFAATQDVARTILNDLEQPLNAFAVLLSEAGELEEDAADEALADVPNGSHRGLLDVLL